MATRTIFETATNTYIAERSIGDGGCGTVFHVTDSDGASYALKLLRDATATKRKRFKNELAFCRKNQHDRIVKVLDEGIVLQGQKHLPFYVMPLYDSSLRKLMEAGVSPSDALTLYNDILDGVEAAHLQNVIHRDLKPENLLIAMPGRHVVVADFGVAHFEEEDLLTAVRTAAAERLANYRYSAPEQRTAGRPVDYRADIFALGLILNELFTGEVPQGSGPRRIAAAAPNFGYLDQVVEKMIRQDPIERPSSIRAIKGELMMLGVEFTTHQKLDQIRKTVVPVATPDDPLGGADVVASAFDYEPGTLIFRLEPAPPREWMDALHSLGGYRSYSGLAEPALVRPTTYGFTVPAREEIVAEIARMVQEWVHLTNMDYRIRLSKKAQEQARIAREDLAKRQRELEEQARAMKRLREARLA